MPREIHQSRQKVQQSEGCGDWLWPLARPRLGCSCHRCPAESLLCHPQAASQQGLQHLRKPLSASYFLAQRLKETDDPVPSRLIQHNSNFSKYELIQCNPYVNTTCLARKVGTSKFFPHIHYTALTSTYFPNIHTFLCIFLHVGKQEIHNSMLHRRTRRMHALDRPCRTIANNSRLVCPMLPSILVRMHCPPPAPQSNILNTGPCTVEWRQEAMPRPASQTILQYHLGIACYFVQEAK